MTLLSLPSDPIVSVILPVRNGGRFFARAVESVLSQTFSSFELLVVDDGSTDRSDSIAIDKARADSRIVILRNERRGIAHALNTGLKAARGRYIGRMDADDISHPARLERQITFLEAHPDCVAVGAGVDVIDAEDETVGFIAYPPRHPEIVDALMTGATPALAHPAMVMRKDAVLAAGAYRHEEVPCEDLGLWFRLIDVGAVANLEERLLRYRMHPGSTSLSDSSHQRAATLAIRGAARARRGLAPLHAEPWHAYAHRNAAAGFHYECVRTALTSRNRSAVFKHARAGIRLDPRWWRPYAALALSALPQRGIALLMNAYIRLRNPARASTR